MANSFVCLWRLRLLLVCGCVLLVGGSLYFQTCLAGGYLYLSVLRVALIPCWHSFSLAGIPFEVTPSRPCFMSEVLVASVFACVFFSCQPLFLLAASSLYMALCACRWILFFFGRLVHVVFLVTCQWPGSLADPCL